MLSRGTKDATAELAVEAVYQCATPLNGGVRAK